MFILYYLFTSSFVEKIGEEYYSQRILQNKVTPKVYDVFHKYFHDLSEYGLYNDIYTYFFLIPLLFNFNILKEFVGLWIPIFFIRSIFNIVTILPKYKNCNYDPNLKLNGGCYDKVFSGHFSTVVLATLLYVKYNWISIPLGVLLVLFSAFGILVTRSHYTIDILVAFFITLFVYSSNLTIVNYFK